jgi:Arc/MetJ family transcription regulator
MPMGSMCIILLAYTHWKIVVRTNIVIDAKLMAEALRLSGAPTKRQVVEDSLRLLIQVKRQERIRKARGKLRWTGDLAAMRRDH